MNAVGLDLNISYSQKAFAYQDCPHRQEFASLLWNLGASLGRESRVQGTLMEDKQKQAEEYLATVGLVLDRHWARVGPVFWLRQILSERSFCTTFVGVSASEDSLCKQRSRLLDSWVNRSCKSRVSFAGSIINHDDGADSEREKGMNEIMMVTTIMTLTTTTMMRTWGCCCWWWLFVSVVLAVTGNTRISLYFG